MSIEHFRGKAPLAPRKDSKTETSRDGVPIRVGFEEVTGQKGEFNLLCYALENAGVLEACPEYGHCRCLVCEDHRRRARLLEETAEQKKGAL